MTLGKITLTNDEINEYNKLKQMIREARTRVEISLYTKRAEEILDKGRLRYVDKLEKSNKPQVKGIQDKNRPKDKKLKLSAYAAASHSHTFPQHIKRSPIMTKLVKTNSGR
ncbi:hypothetical protein GRF59_20520 [Paenibacillus sp. HJL G12]|uniref:Uncharacterized protein n=1 Tax=Paenibacillus dendrobii TaxID=2691084 RepID=A0A7X3IPS5_9BACL|nr:hypothetical protein [Paenibacillus dendrobii]MWV46007.1 hypothetical protein [Paenibacillus dendrobii]